MNNYNVCRRVLTELPPSLGSEKKSVQDVFIEIRRRVAGAAQPWIAVSIRELARTTRYEIRTIYRALSRLEELGLIARESGGGRQVNRFAILGQEPGACGGQRTKNALPVTGDRPIPAAAPAASAQDSGTRTQKGPDRAETLAELAARAYRPLEQDELERVMKLGPEAILCRILRQMVLYRNISARDTFARFLRALQTVARVEVLEASIRELSPPLYRYR